MALIPPGYLDCVVAIGFRDSEGSARWSASGFLYGRSIHDGKNAPGQYRLCLVTNRHVFADQPSALLRFNPDGEEPAREYFLELTRDGKPIWFGHKSDQVDVAVVPINGSLLQEQGIKFGFFQDDQHVLGKNSWSDVGLSEGDGVFVLGFPMGMIGEKRNYVIVRGGVLARIRDAVAGVALEALADCQIFPGNSGGPLITKPEVVSISGTKAVSISYLIGIVASYVRYRDEAWSLQTKRPRIVFEENSGLTSFFPIDYVAEIIDEAIRSDTERNVANSGR